MTDSIRVAGRRPQHELRRAVELRIARLGNRQRMKLDAASKFVAHVRRQFGQRRFDAEKLLEERRSQRAQPPRLELQFGPQPIDRRRIVDAELCTLHDQCKFSRKAQNRVLLILCVSALCVS